MQTARSRVLGPVAVASSGPLRPIDDVHRLTVSDREGVVSYALNHEGLASTRLMGGGGVPHTRRVISGLREQTAVLRGGVLARRQAQQHL